MTTEKENLDESFGIKQAIMDHQREMEHQLATNKKYKGSEDHKSDQKLAASLQNDLANWKAKHPANESLEYGVDEEVLMKDLVEVQPIKEEQIPEQKSIIDLIREKSPQTSQVVKNSLFQKVGQYINKIRSGIANESFLGEMHHDDVQVGQKVMIHNHLDPKNPKMGTVHMVDNTPSHKYGAKMVHVKDEEGNVKIHLPSSLSKVHENINETHAPGTEAWVKANKKKFVDEYGEKKGLEVLFATSWKMHDKQKNESVNEALSDKNFSTTELNKKIGTDIHSFKRHSYETKKDLYDVDVNKATGQKHHLLNGVEISHTEKTPIHREIEKHFGI
jgi:hypothetical protein